MGVDECVWCQPSSGSETTCERPNQEAQWCVVPMLGCCPGSGSFVYPPGQSKSSPVRSGVGSWSSSLGLALTTNWQNDWSMMPSMPDADSHATRRNQAMRFEFQIQPRLDLAMLEQMHGAAIAVSRLELSCEEWDGMERDGKTVGGAAQES